MNKLILFSYPLMFVAAITSMFVAIDRSQVKQASKKLVVVLKVMPTIKPKASSALHTSSALDRYVDLAFGKERVTAAIIMKEHQNDCKWGKGTTHVGLFAIDVNDPRVKGRDMTDCIDNVDVAKAIYEEEGWTPWGK